MGLGPLTAAQVEAKMTPEQKAKVAQAQADTKQAAIDKGMQQRQEVWGINSGMTYDQYKALAADPAFENEYMTRLFLAHSNAPGHSFGNGSLGYDYSKAVLNDPSYAEQFRRKPGEQFGQWIQRLEQTFPGISKSAHSTGMYNDQRLQDYFKYDSVKGENGLTPGQTAEMTRQAEEAKTMAQIREFADNLLKPLDENDPEVRQIMTNASNATEKQARLQGVQGPMSIANTEDAMQKTLVGYNADRSQRGFQALQYKHAAQLGEGQMLDAARKADWERQAGMAKSQADKSPLPLALGIGGAAVGGVAGFFAGGPAGAAAGAGAGFGMGSGAGKILSQPNIPPPPPSRYRGSY